MNIDKVKTFFTNDKWLVGAGVIIEDIGNDSAVCSLEITPDHLNAMGVIQGGATYTLADSAFAIACNATNIDSGKIGSNITVSQSATINYFKPPKGKKLFAAASKISGGTRVSTYRIDVKDELGTYVAMMIGNAYTIIKDS